ncbi:MAG: thiamine phosphate synthase [Candidatus Omnitrophota bacterium]|jgi:thiamine-phosphate pyrophosphorylase
MDRIRKQLSRAKLYIILDTQVQDYPALFKILKESVRAGEVIVQLRDKFGKARDSLRFIQKALKFLDHNVPFIVNDRVDWALAAQASGVHLGQEDIPLPIARKILGRKALIGMSCQTLAQVRKAEADGADYIGFGSVFKTLTKPDRSPMELCLLTRVIKTSNIPVFAIGGITLQNLSRLTDRGVHRVAVTRAVCLSDRVERTTKFFLERLNSVKMSGS